MPILRRQPLWYPERPVHERPCADVGLISYRYRGPYGWVMIGAKNHDDALNEAHRSCDQVLTANLEVWDATAERYVKTSFK